MSAAFNLEPFLDAFFEESGDQIALLESGLRQIQANEVTPGLFDDLHRAAHTLKGNSATFGYRDVVSVAHRVEMILNRARHNGGGLDPCVNTMLIEIVDELGDVLRRLQAREPVAPERMGPLVDRLQEVLDGATPQPAAAVTPPVQVGWRIAFLPHETLMRRGNDPALIFRSLEHLGALRREIDLSNLPSLSDMHPTSCYLRWTLVLEGDVPRDLVEEVFDWVAEDCDLTIEPLYVGSESANEAVGASATAPASRQGSVIVPVAQESIERLDGVARRLVQTQAALHQLVDELPSEVQARLRARLDDLAQEVVELNESVLEIRG